MKCKRLAQIVFCLWIVAMFFVWIIFHNEPQCIDACRFIRNAISNWNNGTLYPSRIDLYQDYITAVGYSNLLQLIHLVFGNIGWMQFINMAMNIGIVLEMFYIARSLFSATTGYIAVTLYCLMTTNLFPFIQLVTEIPYLFLALSGFTLCIKAMRMYSKHDSQRYLPVLLMLAAAGIIFALAHTMRPLELAFLVPGVIYIIYLTVSKAGHKLRNAWKTVCINVGTLLIPYLIVLCGIGLFFKSQSGLFVNGSMTGWYNIVRSADPVTPISCSLSSVYEKGGIAYVKDWEHTTVMQRNAVFRDAFIKWFIHHPFKYTSIVAIRSIKCWGADYFYIPELTKYDNLLKDESLPEPQRHHALTIRRIVEIGYSAVWYVAFIFCIIGVIVFFRNLQKKKTVHCKNSVFLLLSILILGTIGTALFPIEIRYHYPYTWALTILGAETIRRFIANRLNRGHKADCQTHA